MKIRKSFVLSTTLAVMLTPMAGSADMLPCEEMYTRGVSAFQAGDFALAERFLMESTALSPEADAEEGGYIPYIYLAATRYELGQFSGARDALIQSQVYGASAETRVGKQMIRDYAVSIMSAPATDRPMKPQASPLFAESDSLSDFEAELVRARVLKRCALSSDIDDNKLPWYFHYLLGLEYSESGDKSRAVHAFQMGANLEDSSSRNKRLYGTWFMEYLPFYQIAVAQAELEHWSEAREALYASLAAGEFEEGSPQWDRFQELERMLDQRLGDADSS
jgi:hypothetical protein